MIFDNIEYYYVSDIKFSKQKFDLYVPDYMNSEYSKEQLDAAIRSYAFYYLEPNFSFKILRISNAIELNPTYIEQSFNADDADAIHDANKEQVGSLLRNVDITTRDNFIVPFDSNCTKYASEMSVDEITEQELFEHMMWSLPVHVFIPIRYDLD